MIEQIGEKLIASHGFEGYPSSLIDQEQQRPVPGQVMERLRGQGMDPNQLPDEQRKQLVENLVAHRPEERPYGLDRHKITSGESIETNQKDIEAYIEKIYQSNQTSRPTWRKLLFGPAGEYGESIKEWIQQ